MSRFKMIVLFLSFPLFSCCQVVNNGFDFSMNQILIASNGDVESVKSADYFHHHLRKRRLEQNRLVIQRSDEYDKHSSHAMIYFEVVPDLDCDYEIVNEKNKLSLYAKERSVLKWLSYLLIEKLAMDHQLHVGDLPPNYLDFKSRKANFYMKYREPHLLPNLDLDYSGIILTNHIDRDWGLWGHHLGRVFVEGMPVHAQAEVQGKRMKEQFCFSSKETFEAISNFVIDGYGHGEQATKWFMIAPNDNDLVCTCSLCRSLGNTNESATAAVANMLNKLAQKFPRHYFFTTAYRTVQQAPKVRLEANSGVFVSTIDLPKSPILNVNQEEVLDFSQTIKNWTAKADHLYLWDYISNFDDYITPFPVLQRVKSQMKYFSKLGVEGLFLNGSGYDYSPFDDVKAYVLSAIMIDDQLEIPKLVKNFYLKFYPVTGELLSAYILNVEAAAHQDHLDLGVYIPFRSAAKSYFDVNKFMLFYQQLGELRAITSEEEGRKVDRLLTALSYTQLQIMYDQGNLKNGFLKPIDGNKCRIAMDESMLSRLAKYTEYESLIKYKEEGGRIKLYLEEWKVLMENTFKINHFAPTEVTGTTSGEIYADAPLLINNLPGFTSDFNQGWFIAGEDISIAGNANLATEKAGLMMRFLIHPKHRMLVPDRVELFAADKKIMSCTVRDFDLAGKVAVLEKEVLIPKNAALTIRIYKNKTIKKSVIACDEIQLY